MSQSHHKKVLMVITKSNFGGAQRYVYDVATALKEEGYTVAVALGGTGAPGAGAGMLKEKLENASIQTHFIESFSRDVFVINEWRAFVALVRLFIRERPDIVHLNSSKAGGVGALAARIAGVPRIVYTSHGWAFNDPVPWYTRFFRWVASAATVILVHRIIAASHFEALHTPLGFHPTTIHHGILRPAFLPRAEAQKHLRDRAHISDNLPLIGTIAELHPNKGVDILVEAATRIQGAHMIIMGEGQDRNALEKFITAHDLTQVHLIGFVSEAASLLQGLDIFILPSRKEALGYVLLEAGAAGLPIIATTVGGIPEVIDDGISGKLVPPYDPESIAEAIQELLINYNTRTRYGEELQKKVERYFNLRGMIKKTIEVYES